MSRLAAWLFIITIAYVVTIILVSKISSTSALPISVTNGNFTVFLPFTHTPFFLGDYSVSFFVFSLGSFLFYTLFLWLLGNVFWAFRQPRLFTNKGVLQLSRFYIINLAVPILFIILIAVSKEELSGIIHIIFLHLIIGVFTFFMASIFKQGVLLQEEQDLTF